MRKWIDIAKSCPLVESVGHKININDLPLAAKHDIIDMLLTNCPDFKEFWTREHGIMSFNETYVAQFIFGTEDLLNASTKGYSDQPFAVRELSLDPQEIDNRDRPVSDNVVQRYAALATEPPPILVRRFGTGWNLVEGGHRLAAAKATRNMIRAYDVSMFFEIDWDTIAG